MLELTSEYHFTLLRHLLVHALRKSQLIFGLRKVDEGTVVQTPPHSIHKV